MRTLGLATTGLVKKYPSRAPRVWAIYFFLSAFGTHINFKEPSSLAPAFFESWCALFPPLNVPDSPSHAAAKMASVDPKYDESESDDGNFNPAPADVSDEEDSPTEVRRRNATPQTDDDDDDGRVSNGKARSTSKGAGNGGKPSGGKDGQDGGRRRKTYSDGEDGEGNEEDTDGGGDEDGEDDEDDDDEDDEDEDVQGVRFVSSFPDSFSIPSLLVGYPWLHFGC